jgi:hypothetical protein
VTAIGETSAFPAASQVNKKILIFGCYLAFKGKQGATQNLVEKEQL